MRRKNSWDRFVKRLKASFEGKTRKRYQRRRMFLEPLELRQLLAGDLDATTEMTDPAAEDGSGADWVADLLAYEDFVGPSGSSSVPSVYQSLEATPLDWQSAVGNATDEMPEDGSAPNPDTNSTGELLDGGADDYSIETLAGGTSLGMLDTGANLPDSAVNTISTLQE